MAIKNWEKYLEPETPRPPPETPTDPSLMKKPGRVAVTDSDYTRVLREKVYYTESKVDTLTMSSSERQVSDVLASGLIAKIMEDLRLEERIVFDKVIDPNTFMPIIRARINIALDDGT